jgi:putative addiction module CopG family antidote
MENTALEQFVRQQLARGKYPSYEAMVQAGLSLLREREQALDRLADELRPAMQDYLQGDRGETVDIEAIKTAGRRRLADDSRPH